MKTIKKAQTGVAMEKKTTITAKPKMATKKTKTISQRLGDTTLRDVKNAGEDALQLATLGGYGKAKKALGGEYKYKKIGEKKYGGKITKAKTGISVPKNNSVSKNIGNLNKAKNGKSFPDLNKDGKITKADILKGRGVIAKKGATVKKAKSGKKVKKAFLGSLLGGVGKNLLGNVTSSLGGMLGGGGLGKMMGSLGGSKTTPATPMDNKAMKKGGKVSKAMKSGGSMKKCKNGCK